MSAYFLWYLWSVRFLSGSNIVKLLQSAGLTSLAGPMADAIHILTKISEPLFSKCLKHE